MSKQKIEKQAGVSPQTGADANSDSLTLLQDVVAFIAQQTTLADFIAGIPPYLQKIIDADYCLLELVTERDSGLSQHILYGQAPQDITDCKSCLCHSTETLETPRSNKQIHNDGGILYLPLSANNNFCGSICFGNKNGLQLGNQTEHHLHLLCSIIGLMLSHFQQSSRLHKLSSQFDNEIVARERDNQILMSIVEGIGAQIGKDFFRSVVQHLCNALNARDSYIGTLSSDRTRIQTIAVWHNGKTIDNFEYSIEGETGSACDDKLCYCCDSVKALLPDRKTQEKMAVKSCWALPLNNSHNETIGVLVVMHDKPMEREDNIIPVMKIFAARSVPELERTKTEELLFKEKERAQVTLSSIGDGVITTDANGLIEYINPSAEKMLGWILPDAKGRPIKRVFNITDGSPMELFISSENYIKKIDKAPSDAILTRKNGTGIPITYSTSSIRNKTGQILGDVVVFHDISTFKNLMDQVVYQASHDEMTGLINRREMEKEIVSLIETCHSQHKSHALMFIDLDRFKAVNDTCGHVAGDELLKQISSLMLESVRDNDLVARIGGDEFAILLQSCPLDVAANVAEKIRRKIKNHHYIRNGLKFQLSASIGLIPLTKDSGDLSNILNTADVACYVAKELGRDNVYISSQDDTAIHKYKGDVKWSYRIHEAIEKNLFCLHFQEIQPLFDYDKNHLHYEILLRLKDKDNEIILPMAFIPIAERFKLMTEIDKWVIRKTFENIHLTNNITENKIVHCAINLSGQSLGDNEILGLIVTLADELNIDPGQICFEITETAAVENITSASTFIQKLREIGFKFALDDFGSGLSSFSYLKNLPVDYLKIDGEFIKDMATNDTDRIMVDSINRIGKSMGMKIIAEFVEDKETATILQEIGVDYAQGYFIGRPKPLT